MLILFVFLVVIPMDNEVKLYRVFKIIYILKHSLTFLSLPHAKTILKFWKNTNILNELYLGEGVFIY